MREIEQLIARVAPSEANILLTGESGVGKEVCADEIHRLSARANGPIVKLNCGARMFNPPLPTENTPPAPTLNVPAASPADCTARFPPVPIVPLPRSRKDPALACAFVTISDASGAT